MGRGGGEAKTWSLFIFYHFFIIFIIFLSFFIIFFHFFFVVFSFFLHFPLRFFFVCVIIFFSFLRCRSPRSSFFLHLVFIFPAALRQNLHFVFISLPAVPNPTQPNKTSATT